MAWISVPSHLSTTGFFHPVRRTEGSVLQAYYFTVIALCSSCQSDLPTLLHYPVTSQCREATQPKELDREQAPSLIPTSHAFCQEQVDIELPNEDKIDSHCLDATRTKDLALIMNYHR